MINVVSYFLGILQVVGIHTRKKQNKLLALGDDDRERNSPSPASWSDCWFYL